MNLNYHIKFYGTELGHTSRALTFLVSDLGTRFPVSEDGPMPEPALPDRTWHLPLWTSPGRTKVYMSCAGQLNSDQLISLNSTIPHLPINPPPSLIQTKVSNETSQRWTGILYNQLIPPSVVSKIFLMFYSKIKYLDINHCQCVTNYYISRIYSLNYHN